jgi:hypothetical protein
MAELRRLFRDGTPQECKKGDECLCKHFEQLLPKIEQESLKDFPQRRQILVEAFEAHKYGHYTLSIPVLLAQAEGIGGEMFGVSIYAKNSDELAARVRDCIMMGPYRELLISLLPVNASRGERDEFNDPLNRHLVLHGESTDYPTRLNAYKTVSWFQYVASFKMEEDIKKEVRTMVASLQAKTP